VILAAAWWYGRRAHPPEPALDPLASMAPLQAYENGLQLAQRGNPAASLPWLRRGAAGMPQIARAHADLGAALTNAALQTRVRQGRLDPLVRSSVERVAYVLEGDRETEAGIALASTRHDAAVMLFERASTYSTWGMPADALVMLRKAHELDPAWEAPPQVIAVLSADLARGGVR
jgi:hypothetical protein